MGIESEQLVYDYLSRVGDLAGQAPGLTAADRARLVNELRQSIDSQRASSSSSSVRAEVGSVRKILAGLGTPEQVVRRAAGGGSSVASGPAVPASPSPSPAYGSAPSGAGMRSSIPSQAGAPTLEGRAEFVRADAGSVPATGAQWWTFESGGAGFPGAGVRMVQPPGWSGSFEGDFMHPEATASVDPITGLPTAQPSAAPAPGAAGGVDADAVGEAEPAGTSGLLRRLLGGGAGGGVSVSRPSIPFVEALATLVLAAAAVTGFWYVAVLGWLFAYAGRRFGHRAGRFAALWIPGLMAAACGFWLYSRTGHTPGHPGLTGSRLSAATHNAFSFWLRASSGLSAAFLAFRISRR